MFHNIRKGGGRFTKFGKKMAFAREDTVYKRQINDLCETKNMLPMDFIDFFGKKRLIKKKHFYYLCLQLFILSQFYVIE